MQVPIPVRRRFHSQVLMLLLMSAQVNAFFASVTSGVGVEVNGTHKARVSEYDGARDWLIASLVPAHRCSFLSHRGRLPRMLAFILQSEDARLCQSCIASCEARDRARLAQGGTSASRVAALAGQR
jgi:hypothetical protein